jgi:uncharacterized protein with GYD domain
MGRYVVLMNLTKEGVTNIKEGPDRVEEARQALEAVGGKLLDFYLTMGPYDYVAITEVPDDETGMLQLFGLGATGRVRTTTLKAFTLEEFKGLVDKLP